MNPPQMSFPPSQAVQDLQELPEIIVGDLVWYAQQWTLLSTHHALIIHTSINMNWYDCLQTWSTLIIPLDA